MATSARADPPTATPDHAPDHADVVVTAPDQNVIEAFVRDLTDPARTSQIPLWEHEVCPGIVGLAADKAVVLNGRIEEVAQIAGLRHGKPGCRPNIVVIFSTDPAGLAAGFARRFPTTLGRDGRYRLRRFVETRAPVRWVSQTDVGTADGDPIVRGFGAQPDIGRMSGSRIKQSTRAIIGFMLLIVDGKQLDGLTLGDLGDYLGMVAIARPPLDRPPPRESILSALTDRAASHGLSDRDRAYLAALYRAPASGSATTQRSAIRAGMEHSPPPPSPER